MAPPSAAKVGAAYRPTVARRPGTSALLGFAAAAWALASWTSAGFVGGGLATPASCVSSKVALAAVPRPAPEKFGRAMCTRYEGYVFRRKRLPGIHIRLDQRGQTHKTFFRILVQYGEKPRLNSGRYLEKIGWWDPLKEVDDSAFFKMKCDRAVYWLRAGAMPTDGVASLLDRAGIIRRTGPNAKRGEWEWRVPKTSGPEAPEGWSYDGPHSVTWNNKPDLNMRGRHKTSKRGKSFPLIERFGFKGYARIPIDQEVITDPVDGSALSSNFPNTELPPI